MSGRVYTMEDLRSRERLDDGCVKPAILAVIGSPVSHSASPPMHQPALDELGIEGRYIKLEVPVGRVAEALQSQRSRAAAAEALKAKTKVCIISAFFYAIALRPCVFSPSRNRLGHLSCKPLVLLLRPKYQPQSNEFM